MTCDSSTVVPSEMTMRMVSTVTAAAAAVKSRRSIVSESCSIIQRYDTDDTVSETSTTTSSVTAPVTALISKLETPYRNNASKVLHFHVNVQNQDHFLYVTKTLCPELLLLSSSSSSFAMSNEPLTVRPFVAGGLSNELFLVENTQTQFKVLVRIHPEHSEHSNDNDDNDSNDIVNRDDENHVAAWLSRTGDAPVYYGRFCNGRVEEFYDNHTTLSNISMIDHTPGVATLLSSLHTKTPPVHILSSFQKQQQSVLLTSHAGNIWDRGDRWLDMARRKVNETASTCTSTNATVSLLLVEIEKEWTWLKQTLQSRIMLLNQTDKTNMLDVNNSNDDDDVCHLAQLFCSQIVFTHMDCQSLNILIPIQVSDTMKDVSDHSNYFEENACDDDDDDHSCCNSCTSSISSTSPVPSTPRNITSHSSSSLEVEKGYHCDGSNKHSLLVNIHNNNNNVDESTGRLRLIDYEYAGMNPRGADIANTFCEYCDMNNLKANYKNEYPTSTIQNIFLETYINNLTEAYVSGSVDSNDKDSTLIKYWTSTSPSSQERLNLLSAIQNEIGKYTLISHLTWSIWSLVKAMPPPTSTCPTSTSTSVDQDKDDDIIPPSSSFDYVAYAKQRMDGYYYFQNLYY